MHSIKLHHQLTLPHFHEEQPPRCADWKRVKSLLSLMATSGYQIVTFKIFVMPDSLVNQLLQNLTLQVRRAAEHLGQADIHRVQQETIGLQLEAHTLRRQANQAETKAGTGTATAHFQT